MKKGLLKLAILLCMPLTAFAQNQAPLKVGDAVTTSRYLNGTVEQVLPNGTVHVFLSDVNKVWIYKTTELSKRITSLNGISENDAVTLPNHLNGVVRQVFANGMAHVFVPVGNTVLRLKIAELSKRVTSLNGISENDVVATPAGLKGEVRQVFSDGTVHVFLPIANKEEIRQVSELELVQKSVPSASSTSASSGLNQ